MGSWKVGFGEGEGMGGTGVAEWRISRARFGWAVLSGRLGGDSVDERMSEGMRE